MGIRVLALLTARNEAPYVRRCLDHLIAQGCEVAFVDHGSTDGTRELAAERLGHGVARIDDQPWTGSFELVEQLRQKERIAREEPADWYLHVDADEIKEAPRPWSTLREAFEDVGCAGFNAIDFDEFVFVPTVEEPDFTDGDYVAEMRSYYHYEPDSPDRWRVNAWQGGLDRVVNLTASGGHRVAFDGMRIYPRPFILRHYPVLSAAHADAKYGNRMFAAEELAKSWHSDRARYRNGRAWLPSAARLRRLADGEQPDPHGPWALHPFLDPHAGPRPRPTRSGVAPGADAGARARLDDFHRRHAAHIAAIAPIGVTAPGGTEPGPRPLWSVVLPVRNPQPGHLEAALASVLDQDPGPARMEIIVLDDASDRIDAAEIVQQHGRGRVRFERNPQPLGLPGNWNRGIELSAGSLVHLLHQDDRVLAGFYDRLGRPLDDDDDLVGAYCRTSGIDVEGAVLWTQVADRTSPGIVDELLRHELDDHRMLCPALVVRRSSYEALGGYRTDMGYCTDWDFTKRLAALGPVWFDPLPLAQWRTHDGQASTGFARNGLDLAERERSIRDSLALLPPGSSATDEPAMRNAILFTLETLRRHVEARDTESALAQARQLLDTLTPRLDGGRPTPPPAVTVPRSELTASQRRVEQLEAQVQGWVRAVRIARTRARTQPRTQARPQPRPETFDTALRHRQTTERERSTS